MIRLTNQIVATLSAVWPKANIDSIRGAEKTDFTLETDPLIMITVDNIDVKTIIVSCLRSVEPKPVIATQIKIESTGEGYSVIKFDGSEYQINDVDDIPQFVLDQILIFLGSPEDYRQ